MENLLILGVPTLRHFRVTVITSLISMFRGPGLLAVAAKELSINSAKAYATK